MSEILSLIPGLQMSHSFLLSTFENSSIVRSISLRSTANEELTLLNISDIITQNLSEICKTALKKTK